MTATRGSRPALSSLSPVVLKSIPRAMPRGPRTFEAGRLTSGDFPQRLRVETLGDCHETAEEVNWTLGVTEFSPRRREHAARE